MDCAMFGKGIHRFFKAAIRQQEVAWPGHIRVEQEGRRRKAYSYEPFLEETGIEEGIRLVAMRPEYHQGKYNA